MKSWSRSFSLSACMAVFIFSGCALDEVPFGLEETDLSPPDETRALLTCRVDLRADKLDCSAPEISAPRGVSAAIFGGQGSLVQLESENVAYDAAAEIFSADVTVRNLLTQALGTTDGENAHENGVRVFFLDEPTVTAGTGAVLVGNASGSATFFGSTQAYFQYDQVLVPGRRSLAKTWEWKVPTDVESFTFQVGISAEVPGSLTPAGRPPGLDPQTIALGNFHSCGLTLAGTAYCWGRNDFGQLGLGIDGITDSATPTAIPGHVFTSITAGYRHTCGLKADRTAHCWGLAADGQLGNGVSGILDDEDPESYKYEVSPVPVLGSLKFIALSAGGLNTCGLTAEGEAYCWGAGKHGQLGNGESGIDPETGGFVYANTPVRVAGDGFIAISVGSVHNCALTTSNTAHCWGVNRWGQLGNDDGGETAEAPVFADLPVPVAGGQTFASISAGLTHTCALTKAGEAYCWGQTSNGLLGDGTSTGGFLSTPQQVADTHRFASISAGSVHSCGLTAQGNAYCWGRNSDGQLGSADPTVQPTPIPIGPAPGLEFAAIGTWGDGDHGHTCALTTTGAIYCWGGNEYGQIGQPANTGANPSPLQVGTANNFAFLSPLAPTAYALAAPAHASGSYPAHTSFEEYVLAGRAPVSWRAGNEPMARSL